MPNKKTKEEVMAIFPYETALENGKPVFIYEDGSALFEDGTPAIEKVVEPDHHRFQATPPLSVIHLAETRDLVLT